jgi:hypothetical protein
VKGKGEAVAHDPPSDALHLAAASLIRVVLVSSDDAYGRTITLTTTLRHALRSALVELRETGGLVLVERTRKGLIS